MRTVRARPQHALRIEKNIHACGDGLPYGDEPQNTGDAKLLRQSLYKKDPHGKRDRKGGEAQVRRDPIGNKVDRFLGKSAVPDGGECGFRCREREQQDLGAANLLQQKAPLALTHHVTYRETDQNGKQKLDSQRLS